MAAAADSPQQGIQSIEVGAQVLRALEAGRGPLALSEVARNCAMHPAKVHRYLVSLVRAGLASQDARTGQYDLGPAARHLGVEALRRMDAESIAAAYTSRLRDQTDHTTNVAVWTEKRTDHRPLGLGHSRAAAQHAGRLGAAAARLGRRLDVRGTPADRADRRRAGHPAGPAGDPYSRPRRAGEASGRSAARRDRELAAPDDLRHGGRSAPPYSAPTGTSCSRSASPCPPACSCKARRTGWPTRSAAPPGRSRRNWDTARRNAPAPTRPQRWRR
jgi:hypothetical protein